VIAGLLIVTALSIIIGAGLALAASLLSSDDNAAVDRINAALPQIQCGQCGYPGCRPYAAALVAGTAAINRCPPGGDATVQALARLLDRPVEPVDATLGRFRVAAVVLIDEDRCTGCGLCLPACPVDAIIGAPRFAHTVLASHCTACELCLPVCPVDCIGIVPA
jgi:electron transport complex protein RnfB